MKKLNLSLKFSPIGKQFVDKYKFVNLNDSTNHDNKEKTYTSIKVFRWTRKMT